MARLPIIDCDSHVEECEATFAYLDERSSADIPHAEARDNHLNEITERPDLSDPVEQKILRHNPARFYGLQV